MGKMEKDRDGNTDKDTDLDLDRDFYGTFYRGEDGVVTLTLGSLDQSNFLSSSYSPSYQQQMKRLIEEGESETKTEIEMDKTLEKEIAQIHKQNKERNNN